MERYESSSHCGAVLIGNEQWAFGVPDVGGDGGVEIFVFDNSKWVFDESKTEFAQFENECRQNGNPLNFISSAEGTFNIYDNDCALDEDSPEECVLTTLSGRYGIYTADMTAVFVKWE